MDKLSTDALLDTITDLHALDSLVYPSLTDYVRRNMQRIGCWNEHASSEELFSARNVLPRRTSARG